MVSLICLPLTILPYTPYHIPTTMLVSAPGSQKIKGKSGKDFPHNIFPSPLSFVSFVMQQAKEYDYVIIGSGFGGSVSALRLAEKGYKVLVIEKGKWFKAKDFPKTNWNLPKWLWMPALRWFGIMKISFFRHITILSGSGVGGGSLVYANTLPVPKDVFFNSGSWKELADWQKELGPHYDTALRMLGATRNPKLFRGDHILEQIGEEIGKKDHFNATNVAVYFGEEGKTAEDPFFGGKGPERTGCIHCGACMTGCRHNAKNTLDKNYLYLAQQLGVEIMAEQEVYDVRPNGAEDGSDGYVVCYQSSTKLFKKRHRVRAKGVVFSAGVLGTIKLLLKLKGQGSLPRVSDRLGQDIRTNNESLICIRTHEKGDDLSEGVAIGSILHTDDDSHMEVVRYGKGSGFWRFSLLPMVRGEKSPDPYRADHSESGNQPHLHDQDLFHQGLGKQDLHFAIHADFG